MKMASGIVLAAALMVTSAAQARGLVMSPEELSPEMRLRFSEQIARAKQTHPKAFEHLVGFVSQADQMDVQRRGRFAPYGKTLKRMDDLLWPAVELLAFETPAVVPQRPLALEAFTAAVVQALGELRNPDLAPLYTAVLDGDETRFLVLQAAVSGLGQLETDKAAAKLVALSKAQGARRDAALAAMGNCRRLTVARALVEALDARPTDVIEARRIVASLGDIGSVAAWKTPAVKHRAEEGAIRNLAAEALVRAYVDYDGEVRAKASNALLLVDAQGTPAMIAAAKKAHPEQAEALDALSARFARNPIR